MSTKLINLTIGTAGHIDHGKTALVKCLTGCDTDRLKAEKERGMSIDLGFAACTVADLEVGIVDVPGHENFIKTMVAGAAGMDAVILVVAADDGVMPQTREHMEILTLFGVEHGLVAMTKVDRVDPDQVELAGEETRDLLRGTFLEGAPICPVSSVTGEGFDGFLESLTELVRTVPPKALDGVFRLPLDRAFSIKGYGTVVSGIPVSGRAQTGDEVVLLPAELTGRIRRIEVYGHTSDTVMAGQCAALNVGQWDYHKIGRGDTLTSPGYFTPNQWYACTLRLLPRERLHLKNGAKVKLHTGTAEVNAAVYPLKGNVMQPGEDYLVQIRVNDPVVAGPGDRYILRSLTPVQTIGGGMIIEAVPWRLRRTRPGVYEDLQQRAEAVLDNRRFVEYCVRTAESLATGRDELAARTKLPRLHLYALVNELEQAGTLILLAGGVYMHRDTAEETKQRVVESVCDYHRQSPESPGLELEQLREAVPLHRVVLDGVVTLLKTEGRLVEHGHRLANAEHQATFSDEDAAYAEKIEGLFRQQAFHPQVPKS